MTYSYNGMVTQRTIDSYNVGAARAHSVEQEKPDTKECMLEASVSLKFKRAKRRDGDPSPQSNYLRGMLTGKGYRKLVGCWEYSTL